MTAQATGIQMARSQQVLLAAMAVQAGLSFVLAIILGRSLAPGDLGFYSLIGAVFLIARELLNFGSGNLATREISRRPESEGALISQMLWLRRLLGCCLAVLCASISSMEGDPQRRWVAVLASGGILALYLGAYSPVFQVRQAFGRISMLGVLAQAITLGGVVVFVLVGVPPYLFPVLVLLRELISVLGTRVLAVRILGKAVAPRRPSGQEWRFFGDSLRYGMAAVLYNNFVHLAGFMVWFAIGDAALGAYSAALRPLLPALALPWMLMNPMIAPMSDASGKDEGAFRVHAGKAVSFGFGMGLIGAVAGFFMAEDFIRLLYGGAYLDGDLNIVPCFQLLCFAYVFVCLSASLVTVLMTRGKERALLHVAVLGLLLTVGGNLWGLPRFGFVASGWTMLLTEWVLTLACLCVLGRQAWPLLGQKGMVVSLLPGGVLGLILFGLRDTAWLFAAGAVLVPVAFVSLWALPGARTSSEGAGK